MIPILSSLVVRGAVAGALMGVLGGKALGSIRVGAENGTEVTVNAALDSRQTGTLNAPFSVPLVNEAGAAVFQADMVFEDDLPIRRKGIWMLTADGSELIVRALDGMVPVDSPNGGELVGLGAPLAHSRAGRIVFAATSRNLDHPDPGQENVGGLWIGDPTGVVVDPPGGGSSQVPEVRFLESSGMFASPSRLLLQGEVGAAASGETIWGIDLTTGTSRELLIPSGTEDLRLEGVDGHGRAYYLRGAVDPSNPVSIVYDELRRSSATESEPVLRKNDPAPGISGAVIDEILDASVNADGLVSVSGRVSGPGVDFLSNEALWVGEPGDWELVVRSGEGLASTAFGNLRFLLWHEINGSGQVALFARGTTNSRHGIWIAEPLAESGCRLVKVAVEAEPVSAAQMVPETLPADATFFNLTGIGTANFGAGRRSFNDAGVLAFTASLAGSGINLTNNLSVWVRDSVRGLGLAAREDDPLGDGGFGIDTIEMASPPADSVAGDGAVSLRMNNVVAVAVAQTFTRPPLAGDGHWTFDGELAPGNRVPAGDNGGDPAFDATVVDSLGNGNDLRTFSLDTAPLYTAEVPPGSKPDNRSLRLVPNQDLYASAKGINECLPGAWTLEAIFRPERVDRWQVIAGRDGKPTAQPFAPLQLKMFADSGRVAIEILDRAGNFRNVVSTAPLVAGQWYHAAAVNDGATLKLYLQSGGGGFVLQGQVGVDGALHPAPGTFTIGRGMYNGGITDWFDGHVDEVRFVTQALDVSEFLGSTPNLPPVVANPITDQAATYGSAFSFSIPADTFEDDESEALEYAATGLPPGTTFDPETRTIAGTCTEAGSFEVAVTATDDGQPPASAGTTFIVVVARVPLAAAAFDYARAVNRPNPTLAGTLDGVLAGDAVTVSFETPATGESPPGDYPITPVLADPGNRLPNYDVTVTEGTLTVGVDSDEDGMPDDWEEANGTDPGVPDADVDLDGDGVSNGDEHEFGTKANDPGSHVAAATAPDPGTGSLTLSWRSVPGRTYHVHGSADPTMLSLLRVVTATGTTASATFEAAEIGSRFFVRLGPETGSPD